MIILKIIIYILLILLLIILSLLAVILLSRLKYSISGSYDDKVNFEAKCSYLFGLIKVSYFYDDGESDFSLTLPFGLDKKIKSDKKTEEEKKTPKKESEFNPLPEQSDNTSEPEDNVADFPISSDDKTTSSEFEEIIFDDDDLKDIEDLRDKEKPKKKKNKKDGIIEKIKYWYNKFNEIKERYDISLLINLLKQYLIKQIKSLGFKGGKINGTIGLSDPSQTGMALGAIGIASAFLPFDININGNFEHKELSVKGNIYGKTYLLKLLLPILWLVIKKPVLTIIKDFINAK